MKKIIQLTIISLLLSFQSIAFAESSKTIGNFIVHYNAISTESLPPAVARAYGITRSKNKGLLNISVLKKGAGFQGVEAQIGVSATNLTGQLRDIQLRKIVEQNAIYYISVFSVANRETLDFSIKVTTQDNQTGNIKLRQQFFAN
ncbi:MAG: DUF4426 domain-containing protein [Gammaproteobacteria bacterium]|jgi:hypothetical protein|nr:DUF4426 domain-containing protein [Gammaproteobacteria bacterium]MBT3725461.1 DUF4426 domain-containing protein [Gammaproteobacteria bacterium]MBT4078163.1 DUF4426 domain-containing protein [Gammaproteobacteria bacterium]MBT4195574.1 DUF4426 domain-containing protein [Gammaproteobacteria bacterium]MBT4448658.1 DUF4426 domain-containing protein [Gammaproteobacteria bacterium]